MGETVMGETVMTIVADQGEVIAFLMRRDTHGGAATTRIDTHGAVVVLAGARAYKLKRAVRFSYMDYSTPEIRRRMCEAEVRLNRLTAPMLYLGVVPICAAADGSLALGPLADAAPAGAVDYAVVMRRFDGAAQFDALAAQGALDEALMSDLAEIIARFHAATPPRSEYGDAAATARLVADQRRTLAATGRFAPDDLERLAALWNGLLARHRALLDRRARDGFVRRCHGDLHLRNICLIEGRPVLFDAIEFSEPIACIDVLYDLAFLLMDLRHRGLGRHAWTVFNRYIGITGDIEGLALLPLYQSLRAAIRAHVGISMADAQIERKRALPLEEEAGAYLALALHLAAPPLPRLVAVGGLSGTGKSTLARALAPGLGGAPGALLLRSDEIRKRLMGVAETARLGPEGYAEEVTSLVYATMRERAAAALAAGRSVIADAVHGRPAERQAIAAVAAAAQARFDGLWLDAAPSVCESRVEARRGDASDADASVVRDQLSRDPGPIAWARLDAARPRAQLVVAAEARLGLL